MKLPLLHLQEAAAVFDALAAGPYPRPDCGIDRRARLEHLLSRDRRQLRSAGRCGRA